MSGGSMSYIYFKVEEAADYIRKTESNQRRLAFSNLLKLCATALHDIEWVDSGDMGTGDENKAIDKVFSFLKSNPKMVKKALAYDSLIKQLKRITKE